MPLLLKIGLVGLITGIIGTALGGAFSLLIKKPNKTMIGALMAISGGIMLAVVFKDLVPEALEMGSLASTGLGTLFGVGLMRLLDVWLPDSPEGRHDIDHPSRLLRTSLLLGLGIAMHNLPEGLAIGAGYAASLDLGLGIAIVLALHNVPEGMAMGGPMRGAGFSPGKILGWTGLAGVPMGIGAVLGAFFGHVSPLFLSTALGFAAGAMLYIIFNQLLPDAKRFATALSATWATAAGIIIGLALLEFVHIIPVG